MNVWGGNDSLAKRRDKRLYLKAYVPPPVGSSLMSFKKTPFLHILFIRHPVIP